MTLDDTLRWAERFPMDGRWPDEYGTPAPDIEPNWHWLTLWCQENPSSSKDFAAWYVEYRRMSDRVWVAACFPQFRVFDWSDADVARARRLVSGHVCGVCGRADDPGCGVNC